MEKAIPSLGYYYLAEIIDSTQNKLVITTNFDSLTEDSLYIYNNKNALVITHESLAKYIDALSNRPTVIKLHRDLLLQPKSGEADVSALSEEWKNILQKIMEIYVPIVIGYGGNDGSLMGFLKDNASKDKTIYWCYKRDNPVNERIKKLLEEYHGVLVPIEDFDDTMYLFGDRFGYEFSEETIQKITSERAEKLIDKYKDWIKNRKETLKTIKKLSDTESMVFDSFKSLSKRNISEFENRSLNEPVNAINYNEIGDDYFFQKDYNKAVEYYTKAIKLEPDNAEYYFSRGVSYYELKKHEKAIDDYTKAIELELDNALYYNNRGVSYLELKQYEKAIEDISKAIELDPNNAKYYYNRGESYNWLNEYEKAIADNTKAIELEADNALYYNGRGASYNWLNEYEKALADHTKAIELAPKNALFYSERGNDYDWHNEYEKAIADYLEAIKLDTTEVKYYRSLVRVLCRTSDFDNALINLNKLMSLDGKSAICYNTRGYFSMKKAKHDKVKCEADVLDDLNKAIELSNNDSLAGVYYRDRAEYYLYSNEPDKAYNDLQKVIALNNLDGLVHFFMARYYEIKGNTQEYERCMNKMKECRYTPDSSDY
jgi:tetratricopeptide (TPR) repeat protein